MGKCYVFDFYETLVDHEANEMTTELWDRVALYYNYHGANYNGFNLEKKFEKAVSKLKNLNNRTEHPEIDLIDVFYKIYKDDNMKPKKWMPKEAAILYRLLTTKDISLRKNVKETLKALKDRGDKLILFANGQRTFIEAEMKALSIIDLFDQLYISSDYGMGTEDESFIQLMTEELKFKKKEYVFIKKTDGENCSSKMGYKTLSVGKSDLAGAEDSIAENELMKIMEL